MDLIDYALSLVNRQPPLLYGQRAINGLAQRGPDSYDCIGFVRECLLQTAPSLWPASWSGPDSWTVPNFLGAWQAHGLPVDSGTPNPGDLLVWSDSQPEHIGIAEDALWYLSALNTERNVCRSTIAETGGWFPTRLVLRTGLYVPPKGASVFTGITPVRFADSRAGYPALTKPGPLQPGLNTLQITGLGGIPAGAIDIACKIELINHPAVGWVEVGPSQAQPSSSVNWFPADSNAHPANLIATLSSNGKVYIWLGSAQPVDWDFDVRGFFAA